MARPKKTAATESESTALTIISPEEQAYLDSLQSEPNGADNGPAQLVINVKSKDADGKKQVIGAWNIRGTDKYHDGTIYFRPVRWAYKLIRYMEDSKKQWQLIGQTIYFNDFRDEILDSLGGLALGRKFGRSYTDDEKAATKKLAEVYMDVFGFVQLGEDDELHPVLMRLRGGKMMKMTEAFRSIPKDKRYSQYRYALDSLQEEASDSVSYWTFDVTPDMEKVLPIAPILKYDSEVLEFMKQNNSTVMESHKKNRAQKAESIIASTANVVETREKKVVLDDDLPF